MMIQADGGWAINAHIDSAKQDAAEKLVQWMDTKEFGQLIADNLFMFSAVPGVTYSDPVLQHTAEGVTPAAVMPSTRWRTVPTVFT